VESLALKMEIHMRTTKRFTPIVLARFSRQNRGQGTQQDYIPWHRVGRSDPSSRGRSHLQSWHGRQRELLSDLEWVEVFFAVMMVNLVDLREQFPLRLEDSAHELSHYRIDAPSGVFPGTLKLAERLRIKHPHISVEGDTVEWTPTTDILLALKSACNTLELLAVSVKPAGKLTRRKIELLQLEKTYWEERGVEWLLITPDQYDERVALTLRNSMPWALGLKVEESDYDIVSNMVGRHYGRSLTLVLNQLANHFGEIDHAQRAFWQAVWSGKLLLDLRREWRPHLPITLLSQEMFWALNPIVSRRSAWN
jgi:hypothetical protein